MLWLLMACASEEDTGTEKVTCSVLDTIAVAAYETDEDGQIWLDATGSTACDEALYGWYEVTISNASSAAQPDGSDIIVEDDLNETTEAAYVAFDMVEWAGQDVEIMLSVCVEPYSGHCYDDDRLGADTIAFTVPE